MYVLKRSHHNPVLVPYRDHYWEAFATFNMSVIKKGNAFYGVYRAIGAPDQLLTPTQISIIGIGKSENFVHFEDCVPFIEPQEEWEKYGCEDPRITYFEGKYYTFYTALSKYPFEASGIKVAVAVSKDLKRIDERHLITPFNAKAMTLFPNRINGKITVVVTVNTDIPPAKIAVAQVDEIEELWNPKFWEEWYAKVDEHSIDLRRSPRDHTEVGAPPIKTKYGWLLLYSHIQNYFSGGDRIFGIEAVLLDLKNPLKIVGRTRGPILVPRESYELLGHVSDIVFPSGAVLEKDTLYIYYGASDTTTCMAHVNITDLLGTMRPKTSMLWDFERSNKNPIIVPDKNHPWESKATFNPAALRIRNKTYILYRALSEDNTSSIGYASTKDGVSIDERSPLPVYVPRENFELKKVAGGNSGCEDPRLTKIGKNIYMCYTAFDCIGPPRPSCATPIAWHTIWRSRDDAKRFPPAADSTANTPLPSRLCIRGGQCRRAGAGRGLPTICLCHQPVSDCRRRARRPSHLPCRCQTPSATTTRCIHGETSRQSAFRQRGTPWPIRRSNRASVQG